MRWRVAINRGDAKGRELWRPNLSHSVVCSEHFVESDYKQGRKRKILKSEAVPSVFSYRSKQSSKVTSSKEDIRLRKDHVGSEVTLEVGFDSSTQVAQSGVGDEVIDLVTGAESSNEEKDQVEQARKTTEVGVQCWSPQPSFCIERFVNQPKAVQYFTGFEDYTHFKLLYDILCPYFDQLQYPCIILTHENQLFLTLMKLRLALDHQLLAYFFDVSLTTVSKIFSGWVNFIYIKLKSLEIWPSRKVVTDTMPADFKWPFNQSDY